MALKKRFDRMTGDKIASVAELIGVALAIEREAVRHYEILAKSMALHRNAPVAALFQSLATEERQHEVAIQNWAANKGVTPEVTDDFGWVSRVGMPAASLADAGGPFLLTPRRALALAVLKEERAFDFYSAIAAGAVDANIRERAEAFAKEELDHVAMLRLARRQAYRSETEAVPSIGGVGWKPPVATLSDFLRIAAGIERSMEAAYHSISRMPAHRGQTAALLTRMGTEARERAGDLAIEAAGLASHDSRKSAQQFVSRMSPTKAGTPLELLRFALQRADEAFEAYTAIAETTPDETIMLRAESLAEHAVEHLAIIGRELALATQ